jgi:hypothetical protein
VLNWCQFLSARTDEELEELAMTDPTFTRAKQALDDLSADPKARELARDREMWHFFYDREMHLSAQAGRAEGRAEGLVTAVRTACRLLGVELTPEREARVARASASELEQLLQSVERERQWPG